MDVYLSREALQELEALNILAGGGEGILRGHRRGQRFFVEHILPAAGAASSSAARLRRFEEAFPEALLGFFLSGPGQGKTTRAHRSPHMVGKVFLEINSRGREESEWQAHLSDYDGTFRLVPLKIIRAR